MVSMTATEASGLRTPVRAGTPSPFFGLGGRTGMSDLDEYAKAEDRAYKALVRHAKAIARDCAAIAHIGDGNCGHILAVVVGRLRDSGLYKDKEPSRPTKVKIPGWMRKQVFERDAYRCVVCRSHIDLEADHVYPESLGGETSVANLQTLCKSCNCKKGNRVTA